MKERMAIGFILGAVSMALVGCSSSMNSTALIGARSTHAGFMASEGEKVTDVSCIIFHSFGAEGLNGQHLPGAYVKVTTDLDTYLALIYFAYGLMDSHQYRIADIGFDKWVIDLRVDGIGSEGQYFRVDASRGGGVSKIEPSDLDVGTADSLNNWVTKDVDLNEPVVPGKHSQRIADTYDFESVGNVPHKE